MGQSQFIVKTSRALLLKCSRYNIDSLLELFVIFLHKEHSVTISDKIEILEYALWNQFIMVLKVSPT